MKNLKGILWATWQFFIASLFVVSFLFLILSISGCGSDHEPAPKIVIADANQETIDYCSLYVYGGDPGAEYCIENWQGEDAGCTLYVLHESEFINPVDRYAIIGDAIYNECNGAAPLK